MDGDGCVSWVLRVRCAYVDALRIDVGYLSILTSYISKIVIYK